MEVRRSTPVRAVVFALVIAMGALIATTVMAAGNAAILTAPVQWNAAVYQDRDADGLNDPDELVGHFDVYDGMRPITFRWDAYPFASGVNGSYRVSLQQNVTPFGAPTWKEITVGHHWASNPNGSAFTVGPYGPGQICVTCPSRFVIQPETYVQTRNTATGSYEYQYTPVAAALGGSANGLEQSEEFVINVTDYTSSPAGQTGTPAPVLTPATTPMPIQ